MLEIRNLHARVSEKEILQGIDLTVNFPSVYGEIDALQNFFLAYARVEIADFKHRLAYAPFQAHAQQLLCFHRKLHGKLTEHFLAKAVNDHGYSVLVGDAALPAVEDLVLADFRR